MRKFYRWFAMSAALIAATTAANAARVPMYVTYSAGLLDYFYTTRIQQRDESITLHGYSDQGIAFYVDTIETPPAIRVPPSKRFFRTWKGAPQYDHFYTTSVDDFYYVIGLGWTYEGHEGYLFPTPASGQVPPMGSIAIHRLNKWTESLSDVQHFYTWDWNQVQAKIQQGWTYDTVAGYGYTHGGVPPGYKAAVLAYHAGFVSAPCTGYSIATVALERDLAMMASHGFTVVPLQWMVEWITGARASSSMPPKPVSITFDDGYDQDYFDTTSHPNCPGTYIKSAKTVLLQAAYAYPGLFAAAPYATSFVVASPTARVYRMPWLHHDWWATAIAENVIDIQNHSTDHDAPEIYGRLTEYSWPWNGVDLAIGSLYNGNYAGEGTFCRIGRPSAQDPTGTLSATREIVLSTDYIASVSGRRPKYFANPQAAQSADLRHFWNTYPHGLDAAFATSGNYVQPGTYRFEIPRFTPGCNWNSPEDLRELLNGAGSTALCHTICPNP